MKIRRGWAIGAAAAAVLAWLSAGTACAWGEPDARGGAAAGAAKQEERIEGAGVPVQAPPITAGHGWVARREKVQGLGLGGSAVRTVVLHLPARSGGGGGGGSGDQRGVLRFAPGLDQAVEMTAWQGNRVWMALAVEPRGKGEWVRRVVTLSAVRNIAGGYDYPPGRVESVAALDGDPDLVGFAATEYGPVALLRERVRGGAGGRAGTPTAYTLMVMVGTEWWETPLPWAEGGEESAGAPPGRKARIETVNWRGGFALVVVREGSADADVWIARLTLGRGESAGPGERVTWSRQKRPLTGPLVEGRVRVDRAVFVQGETPGEDALVAAGWYEGGAAAGSGAEGELRLVSLRETGPAPLASLPGVPRTATVVPMAAPTGMGAGGTVAVVWSQEGGGEGKKPGSGERLEIREVSSRTGRVMYSGEDRREGLIGQTEFRALALMMLVVMTAVLVFVLRAEPEGRVRLPRGWMPADALRRAVAAGLDYVPSAIASAAVMHADSMSLVSVTRVINGEADLRALALALAIAAGHCTVCEWLWGWSLGKLLVGVRVTSLRERQGAGDGDGTGTEREGEDEGLRRLALWQAVVRNVVRWAMPAVGLLMMFDGARRHPGDLAARTAVVMAADDEAEPE